MKQEFNPSENERFLNLYRQLEQLQSSSPETARYLKQRFYDEIETYRKLRNYLSHEEYRGNYPFCVSSRMCDDMERILNLSRAKAIDIASKNIAYAEVGHSLRRAQDAFLKHGYSYLPILDEKRRVLGTVTPLSLLQFEGQLDKKIGDLLPSFALDQHPKRLIFVARNEFAHAVTAALTRVKDGKRVGLAFVTENGKPTESILGVITLLDGICFLQTDRGE